jgi:hypothetical protein
MKKKASVLIVDQDDDHESNEGEGRSHESKTLKKAKETTTD